MVWEDLLQGREHVAHRGDLLVGDEDARVVDGSLHALRVGEEVRGDVAAVDLHALDVLGLVAEALAFLDRDDAVLADLLHDLGDEVAHLVVVGGEGRDLGDLLLAADFLGLRGDAAADSAHGGLDAALDGHRVCAGGDVAEALADHGLREDRCRGRAVTGDVVRLGGRFLQELRTHVLVVVLQLDLLGDGHAVGADVRGAELLVQDDVPAARAQGDLDRVGQRVHADLERLSRLVAEKDLFRHLMTPLVLMRARRARAARA